MSADALSADSPSPEGPVAVAPASPNTPPPRHFRLPSHSGGLGALPIVWGAASARERGPVVGTTLNVSNRNVIGTHSGSYSGYRALAVAAGARTPGDPA